MDVATGQLLARRDVMTSYSSFDVSPDGSRIVTTGRDAEGVVVSIHDVDVPYVQEGAGPTSKLEDPANPNPR